jgi:hypothetical protein
MTRPGGEIKAACDRESSIGGSAASVRDAERDESVSPTAPARRTADDGARESTRFCSFSCVVRSTRMNCGIAGLGPNASTGSSDAPPI